MAKEKALKWTSQTQKETYKNHSDKRETLRNANQNTTSRRAGYKKVNDPPHTHTPLQPPPHTQAFRIKGVLWNNEQNKNTNNNS